MEGPVWSDMASAGPKVDPKTALLANFGQFRGIWCKKMIFNFFWPQNSFIEVIINSLVVTKNT